MKKLASVLCIVFIFFTSIQADELKAVTAIVNHGDTIPSKFYPRDPYQDPAIWKKPLGQLSNVDLTQVQAAIFLILDKVRCTVYFANGTACQSKNLSRFLQEYASTTLGTLPSQEAQSELGEQQSFAVGQWFLKRYILKNPFITLHYNASQIYTFSEDRDESLMSAESILAGFLPPVGNEIWNKKLLWRPTPVHNSPLFLDYAVGRGVPCPRFDQEVSKVAHGRFFRTQNQADKALLEYLSTETGQKYSNVGQIPALYNILQVEQNHNLTLPAWTESVFPDLLGKIVVEDSILRTKNPELARLSIGPLLCQIRRQFHDVVDNKPVVGSLAGIIRRFKLFVANDSLIYDTLHALKVPPVGVVPFSASLIFELWETPQGMNYVKLLYRDSPAPNTPIQRLKIGGCKTVKCPYQQFNNTINPLAVSFKDWVGLCKSGGASATSNNVLSGQPINLDLRKANI